MTFASSSFLDLIVLLACARLSDESCRNPVESGGFMSKTSQHIFLASRSEEETRNLRRGIEALTGEFYPLQFVTTRPHALQSLVDRQSTAVVLQTVSWQQAEIKIIEDLRGGGYAGPVLIISKNRVSKDAQELAAHQPIVFIDRPFHAKDLIGILRKFLSARSVQQQVFRRYPTLQEAEIEFMSRSSGGRQRSRVTNLSKGGAYLEVMSSAPVRVGESVRVSLDLVEMKRSYSMPAKVVWTSPRTDNQAQGFGVEFLGPVDVKSLAD
jgi:hypothetical protein